MQTLEDIRKILNNIPNIHKFTIQQIRGSGLGFEIQGCDYFIITKSYDFILVSNHLEVNFDYCDNNDNGIYFYQNGESHYRDTPDPVFKAKLNFYLF